MGFGFARNYKTFLLTKAFDSGLGWPFLFGYPHLYLLFVFIFVWRGGNWVHLFTYFSGGRGIEPRTSCVLCMRSTTELCSPSATYISISLRGIFLQLQSIKERNINPLPNLSLLFCKRRQYSDCRHRSTLTVSRVIGPSASPFLSPLSPFPLPFPPSTYPQC